MIKDPDKLRKYKNSEESIVVKRQNLKLVPAEYHVIENFLDILIKCHEKESLLDFCRKYVLHGHPKIFDGFEENYYEFRKRIADKFGVNFHEVFITGSAKLGFSPHKKKLFSYDSDIDVAIVSTPLYDKVMDSIHEYQMELRENRKAVTDNELSKYHKFLEYGAIGWMRPDLLPPSFRIHELKEDWFSFFNSLSYGKSEIGNYKVSAGVFKTYLHFEKYTVSGLRSLRTKLQVGRRHADTN